MRSFHYGLSRPVYLLIFIAAFLLIDIFFSYIEFRASCFPVTVISSDSLFLKKIVEDRPHCSFKIESRKVEVKKELSGLKRDLPVKEIFLLTVELPFDSAGDLFSGEGGVVEKNPFITSLLIHFRENSPRIHFSLFLILLTVLSISLFMSINRRIMRKRQFVLWSVYTISVLIIFSLILSVEGKYGPMRRMLPIFSAAGASLFVMMQLISFKIPTKPRKNN